MYNQRFPLRYYCFYKFESGNSKAILTNFICWHLPIRRPKFVGVFPDCGSSSKSPVLFFEGVIEIGRRETRSEYRESICG